MRTYNRNYLTMVRNKSIIRHKCILEIDEKKKEFYNFQMQLSGPLLQEQNNKAFHYTTNDS